MAVTLSKRSVLDEFYAKRHRIIEEGSLYLTYIFLSLVRDPNVYIRLMSSWNLLKRLELFMVRMRFN